MSDNPILNYVKASASALGFSLDEARLQRVAVHLARTAELARQLESQPIDVTDESAEIYCPLPFHASTPDRRAP